VNDGVHTSWCRVLCATRDLCCSKGGTVSFNEVFKRLI
jgi:hypothetical protein